MCDSNPPCPATLLGKCGDITFSPHNSGWCPLWWGHGLKWCPQGWGYGLVVMSPHLPRRVVGHGRFESHITALQLRHCMKSAFRNGFSNFFFSKCIKFCGDYEFWDEKVSEGHANWEIEIRWKNISSHFLRAKILHTSAEPSDMLSMQVFLCIYEISDPESIPIEN